MTPQNGPWPTLSGDLAYVVSSGRGQVSLPVRAPQAFPGTRYEHDPRWGLPVVGKMLAPCADPEAIAAMVGEKPKPKRETTTDRLFRKARQRRQRDRADGR